MPTCTARDCGNETGPIEHCALVLCLVIGGACRLFVGYLLVILNSLSFPECEGSALAVGPMAAGLSVITLAVELATVTTVAKRR